MCHIGKEKGDKVLFFVCTVVGLQLKNRSLTLQDKSGDTRKQWIKDWQIKENHSKKKH